MNWLHPFTLYLRFHMSFPAYRTIAYSRPHYFTLIGFSHGMQPRQLNCHSNETSLPHLRSLIHQNHISRMSFLIDARNALHKASLEAAKHANNAYLSLDDQVKKRSGSDLKSIRDQAGKHVGVGADHIKQGIAGAQSRISSIDSDKILNDLKLAGDQAQTFVNGIKNRVQNGEDGSIDFKAISDDTQAWIAKHPMVAVYAASCVIVPPLAVAVMPPILGVLGWQAGVASGSIAAGVQAGLGNAVAGSPFAVLQSAGAGGAGLAVVNGIVGGATFAGMGALTAVEVVKAVKVDEAEVNSEDNKED
ncbi:hypothetical protein B0J11DRAFT_537742 [Dendryphion nanum]|uniref:Uncharacterized protein n=1 Tax=Dendryphion nanum TaxID=256645 RepID=A0A9P9DAL5_9PLEO|nr:hypothetical protein B0J11DRAFT_537742 [Dendryphion nanum]